MTIEDERNAAAKVWAVRYHSGVRESALNSFIAGWDGGWEHLHKVRESIRQVARQNERCEVRKRAMELAGKAFQAGDDVRAKYYRELALDLFGKI